MACLLAGHGPIFWEGFWWGQACCWRCWRFMKCAASAPRSCPTEAQALVSMGIFSRTRNPIYLGDLLILAGFILSWDAVLSLPLLPILFWVLEKRFVIPEEDRLRRKYRAEFARFCEKTRRWL